jgi:TPR repeat protein
MRQRIFALALLWLLVALISSSAAESLQGTRARAKKGDAVAQWSLGMKYATGDGVKQSWSKAKVWMEKAAAQGNLQAIGDLGVMYLRGYGVKEDYARARSLLEKSANGGHPAAQVLLGNMYADGKGVKQDWTQARAWYEKAAAQGDAGAQFLLGDMYANGQGVEQDWAQARTWYEKAAIQGDAKAQTTMGIMYAQGQGGEKDLAKAREWYQKAADQGLYEAKGMLAELEIGEGTAEAGKVVRANQGREGQAFDLKSLAIPGRRVLVAFYSPYCPSCMVFAPMAEALAAKTDWIIMKVNINRPDIDMIDRESPVAQQFKLEEVLPYFIILDRQGKTVAEGRLARAIMDRQMKQAGVE